MKSFPNSSPLQPVLTSLSKLISALVAERRVLLDGLTEQPPEPKRAPDVISYGVSIREKYLHQLRRKTPEVKALAQALIAACDAADWESFT